VFRALSNLLFRGQDPTRDWLSDPTKLVVDVERGTLCGVAVGSSFAALAALGPADDARQSARGVSQWGSRGVWCTRDEDLLSDFTVSLVSDGGKPFPGSILHGGRPLAISEQTTREQLLALLGEPFAESNADGDTVLYYEHASAEVQFSFAEHLGTLEAIEVWFEPELSQPGALEQNSISKPFPAEWCRRLPA
jgi:hypothetical protein